jgi:hypothetical protein
VPTGGCSEAIVLVRGGKRRGPFERRGDRIEVDNGLKKRDTPYIYLQSASLAPDLADYVNIPQENPFPLHLLGIFRNSANSDDVFPLVLLAGGGLYKTSDSHPPAEHTAIPFDSYHDQR